MLRFSRPLAIALITLAAQLCALGAEVAVLRNGRSIQFVRKEQLGDTIRLYTADGYIDVLNEQIASFEVEDTPAAPAETAVPQPQATNLVSPAQPVANKTVDLDEVVREASMRRQLDPDFVTSVIKAESNFHPRAVSPKGAQGLMQLMPGTAALLGVRDPFDPRANVEAGTTYLSSLLDLYHDDPIKALAAYNAGPQRVEQYHGVPPYRETHAYISRIVRDFNAKKRAQVKTAQAQTPVPSTQAQAPSATKKKSSLNKAAKKATTPSRTTKRKVQQAAAATPAQTPGGTN